MFLYVIFSCFFKYMHIYVYIKLDNINVVCVCRLGRL